MRRQVLRAARCPATETERLGNAVVNGVADDRSADTKIALAEEATPPDFTTPVAA
jgi:hypothetical protein